MDETGDIAERKTPTLADEKRDTKERLEKIRAELASLTPEQQAAKQARLQALVGSKDTFGQTNQPEGSTGPTKPEKPLSVLQRRLKEQPPK